MAIKLRIREVAQACGITTSYQLKRLMNIPPGHAARLWKGELKMIGLETIDSVCAALNCDPGDLFARESKNKIEKTQNGNR